MVGENFSAGIANTASINAGELAGSVGHLASGQRVNSARDDAAGLAVRELMRADLATARQATRNINDGVSMLQVADGAASVVSDNLIRMKQLATQASNATLSRQQRTIIHREFSQLAEENAQIAQQTDFNGVNLFQDGQTIDIATGDGGSIDVTTRQIAPIAADLVNDPRAAVTAIEDAIKQVTTMRGDFGALSNRLENAAEVAAVQAENIAASESRISDVDMARQVAQMTADQISVEAAIAAQVHARSVAQVTMLLLG